MKSWFKQSSGMILIIILSIFIPEVINRLSFSFADRLPNPLNYFDPQRWYAFISLHHLIQASMAFFLILLSIKFFKLSLKDFGFQKDGFKQGLKFAFIFSSVWIVIQFFVGTLLILTNQISVVYPLPSSLLSSIGYLLFQWFLSGTSEEILYRALLIPLILQGLAYLKIAKHQTLWVIGITTLAFTLGHIGYTLNPFQITYYNPFQILTVIIFSIAYAINFLRHQNIFAIMIMHNILNGLIVFLSLGFYFLFG